jgi:two-component system, NtrC family, nitrogen regulation response regulator GlnG
MTLSPSPVRTRCLVARDTRGTDDTASARFRLATKLGLSSALANVPKGRGQSWHCPCFIAILRTVMTSRNAPDPDVTVVLVICDTDRTLVEHFVESGAMVHHVNQQVADTPAAERSSPRIGLVRLGTESSREPGLESIRRLAAQGIQVIAYAANAGRWALGARCRALLAGACEILDSAHDDFLDALRARVERAGTAEARLRRELNEITLAFEHLGLVGESDASVRIFRWVARISRLSDLHTLICGETGTGKQLVAEATHRLDPKRRTGPFVALNCAAISPGLAESELFGHRRGAFTGAERDRKGLVRAAHGGVLFLDEIGELDLSMQAKLLRVVQDGRVLGLGDDHESPVDVRVLAATNRNLEAMVREHRFRADLFHRLNVLSVHIPPLRERRADVAPLIRHFLTKHQQLGEGPPLDAGDDFINALTEVDLPGNARQLENIVRRAIVGKDDRTPLGLRDLPPEIWSHVSRSCVDDPAPGDARSSEGACVARAASIDLSPVLAGNDWNLSKSLASCERSLVEAALRAARGNQSETARLLGITPRCIYNKLRRHHLVRTSA